MRVLHITLSYQSAPALGGPDLTSYKLCTALKAQGVDIDVIATNLATKNETIQPTTFSRDVDGINVQYLLTKKLVPLGRHSFGLFYMPELRATLRKCIQAYDLVHVHGYRGYLTLVAFQEAYRAGVPYIIHPRGTIPFQGHSFLAKWLFDRFLGRKYMQRASAIISLSQREVESIKDLGVASSRIKVVYNGIEPSEYDANASGDSFRQKHKIYEKWIVLYLGRVHMIKGIDHMVRAVAGMRRDGWDVAAVIVGPDEGFGTTLKNIATEEKFDALYLIPTVSGKEKQSVFGAADALVYAAEVEDFGVVAFEGVLSGVPTITAAETGCGEVMRHLNVGYLVPYGDVAKIRSLLEEILSDPEAARQQTIAAIDRTVANLGWSDIGKQVLQLYERVLV